jgi:hypothetical protein
LEKLGAASLNSRLENPTRLSRHWPDVLGVGFPLLAGKLRQRAMFAANGAGVSGRVTVGQVHYFPVRESVPTTAGSLPEAAIMVAIATAGGEAVMSKEVDEYFPESTQVMMVTSAMTAVETVMMEVAQSEAPFPVAVLTTWQLSFEEGHESGGSTAVQWTSRRSGGDFG